MDTAFPYVSVTFGGNVMGMCGNARSTDVSQVIEGNFKSWLCLLPTFTDELCPRDFIEEKGLQFAHVPVDVSFSLIKIDTFQVVSI